LLNEEARQQEQAGQVVSFYTTVEQDDHRFGCDTEITNAFPLFSQRNGVWYMTEGTSPAMLEQYLGNDQPLTKVSFCMVSGYLLLYS